MILVPFSGGSMGGKDEEEMKEKVWGGVRGEGGREAGMKEGRNEGRGIEGGRELKGDVSHPLLTQNHFN